MKFKYGNNDDYLKNKKHYERIICEKEDNINMLNSVLSEKNMIISRTKSYLFDLESNLNSANSKIELLEANLAENKVEINFKEKKISDMESELVSNKDLISEMGSELVSNKDLISEMGSELVSNKNIIHNLNNQLNSLKNIENKHRRQLDAKEYCICCYEEKINDNKLEIEYLKKNSLIRKLFSPFSYLYLIFKSNPNELSINFKLYASLKNSPCFDVGYYLNNNDDLIKTKWCKFFSPELHYVCHGFIEKRRFNKKYFNRNSKKELLDYLNEC